MTIKNLIKIAIITGILIVVIYIIRCIYIGLTYPVIEINENAVEVNGFYFNNMYYKREPFIGDDNNKYQIARANNGAPIYAYGDKDKPYYLKIHGSDNSAYFVAQSVPESGTITGIFLTSNRILSSNEDISFFKSLENIKGKEQTFKLVNEEIYTRTRPTRTYYYMYDNSSVTNVNNIGGIIAFIDDKVVYLGKDNDNVSKIFKEDNNEYMTITGIVIEDKGIVKRLKEIFK